MPRSRMVIPESWICFASCGQLPINGAQRDTEWAAHQRDCLAPGVVTVLELEKVHLPVHLDHPFHLHGRDAGLAAGLTPS